MRAIRSWAIWVAVVASGAARADGPHFPIAQAYGVGDVADACEERGNPRIRGDLDELAAYEHAWCAVRREAIDGALDELAKLVRAKTPRLAAAARADIIALLRGRGDRAAGRAWMTAHELDPGDAFDDKPAAPPVVAPPVVATFAPLRLRLGATRPPLRLGAYPNDDEGWIERGEAIVSAGADALRNPAVFDQAVETYKALTARMRCVGDPADYADPALHARSPNQVVYAALRMAVTEARWPCRR